MQLENNGWRVDLSPDHGGTIVSLSRYGRAVLRPAPSIDAIARDPRAAAHYPCAPWFNRLYGGFDFAGRHWPLEPILDAAAALHGEGWINPWRVADATPHSARLEFRYGRPGPGRFPFAFTATQDLTLREDAFRLELRVRNDSARAAPFGLGLHPFFVRRPGATVAIRAAESLAGDVLPPDTIDRSFPGFQGEALIRDAAGVIRMTSDAALLHVYAPAGEDFFCLEPVTHAAGAFGGTVLAPGAFLSVSLELSVEPAPSA